MERNGMVRHSLPCVLATDDGLVAPFDALRIVVYLRNDDGMTKVYKGLRRHIQKSYPLAFFESVPSDHDGVVVASQISNPDVVYRDVSAVLRQLRGVAPYNDMTEEIEEALGEAKNDERFVEGDCNDA